MDSTTELAYCQDDNAPYEDTERGDGTEPARDRARLGGFGRGGQGNGLVNPIISGRTQRLQSFSKDRKGSEVVALVRPSGLGVKVRVIGPESRTKPQTTRRGIISGFSDASRRRMLVRLSAVNWERYNVLFVTLTYHNDWAGADDWHGDLKAFYKRLRRRLGVDLVGMLWRLELVPRKSGEHIGELAPHFHCALFLRRPFGDDGLQRFRAWVSKSWNAIAAPADSEHLAAGTQVLKARNTAGPGVPKLLQYLSKYMAKVGRAVDEQTGEVLQTGRIWGSMGEVPSETLGSYTMSWADYCEFTRRVRRWGRESGYLSKITAKWAGFLILGDGSLLHKLLDGLDCRPFVMPGGEVVPGEQG